MLKMKKGLYYFGESGYLCKRLGISGAICFMVSCVLFFCGGYVGLTQPNTDSPTTTHAIWCVFFLLFSIVQFLAILCINKMCRDIATLLKGIEDKSSSK